MMEAAFAAALLNPGLVPPAGLVDAQGRPAGKRFDVYRNNVVSGLTRVLEAGFPVVRRLVGDAFFAAMAAEFVRGHPPNSRIMMLYGDQFSDFLKQFPPVAHLAYLPDMAKLEQGLRVSYHAADADGLLADSLAALSPDRFSQIKLRLSPSVLVLESHWPIVSIWRANTDPAAPSPVMGREDAVILRPGFDPELHLLPPGGATFVKALQSGETLAAALDSCLATQDDLGRIINILIAGKAIAAVQGAPI
jgi:hypothetical protein